jgi:hypothetical protein
LICIKGRMRDFADGWKMTPSSRPPLRNCPVCGVAMQASRSSGPSARFDTFECLTCNAKIVEQPAPTVARPCDGTER